MNHPITRRRFLQSSAAAVTLAAASVPAIAATTAPATQPVKQLKLGMIGIGGQGSWHLGIVKGLKAANIVAFCDVDQVMLDKAAAAGSVGREVRRLPRAVEAR